MISDDCQSHLVSKFKYNIYDTFGVSLIMKYLNKLKNKYKKNYTNVLGGGVKFKQFFNIKQILSIG